MCSGCARRSSAIRSTPRSWSRSAGSGTRRAATDLADHEHPGHDTVELEAHPEPAAEAHGADQRGPRAVCYSPRRWPLLCRRSIQLRIVAGTLLMSTVVVILIGWVMMNQVTEGVLSSRRDGARTEAGAQVRETQTQLNAADSP